MRNTAFFEKRYFRDSKSSTNLEAALLVLLLILLFFGHLVFASVAVVTDAFEV